MLKFVGKYKIYMRMVAKAREKNRDKELWVVQC